MSITMSIIVGILFAVDIVLVVRVWPDFIRSICVINNKCIDDVGTDRMDRFCANRCITESPR